MVDEPTPDEFLAALRAFHEVEKELDVEWVARQPIQGDSTPKVFAYRIAKAVKGVQSGGPLPLHNRPDGTPCDYSAMTRPNGQWICTKCGAGGQT